VKFDDIIGILFLLLFIVGPALKGLFKPGEPLIEVELPEVEVEPEAPDSARPRPRPTPRQAPVTTAPAPIVAAEDEPVRPATTTKRDTRPSPPEGQERLPDGGRRRVRKLGLKTNRRAVLNGMLWHEILSEPVALKRIKRRRRGAKLE